MAAVSQATTTLLGGISQQPDPNKLPGQVRDAVNVQLNPTFGCEKRPPSKYLTTLASDIPGGIDNVKWFDIFRDSVEKYVACIYREGGTRIRVWDCATGVERSVSINAESGPYLDAVNPNDYKLLTIADYTLITNPNKNVTMDTADGAEKDDEALVVVNQIAYNTSYTINFLKDGEEATPVKVYSASSLSVSPATFTELDQGACNLAGTQSFVENGDDGQTGLAFELTTICQPTQFPVTEGNNSYPTALVYKRVEGTSNFTTFVNRYLGVASQYGNGSYLYITDTATRTNGEDELTVTVECRASGIEYDRQNNPENDGDWDFSKASVAGYDQDVNWREGMAVTLSRPDSNGRLVLEVSAIRTPDDTVSYEYKSVYRTSVKLKNGGTDWRKRDSVTVQMNGREYTVKVETETFGYGFESEASVNYTTPGDVSAGGTLDIGDIVGALTTQINALTNFDAEPIGNVIYIRRTDDRKFNLQAIGGSTEKAMYALKGAVNDVSLLPIQGKDGVVLLVRNSADSQADDYYVRFTTAEGDIPGQGSWDETVKPGIPTDIDPNSLPQVMIRNADGTFTVRPLSPSFDEENCWASRQVGDTESNPEPSFVGRGINNMFFFMNRLGFLSEDKVIMSQPGDYFNFFVGSAIAVSDADPIDMAAASERPSFLKAAVSVPRGCLLFAENAQFMMSTQDVAFGPSTVKINKIADYAYTSNIEPLETGISLMFHTSSATYSKVFEMAIPNVDATRPQVAELTRIIPEYIPPDIRWSASNTNNNQVFFGTGDVDVYNFSFFNVGNERSMSGWTRWRFSHDVRHLAYFQDRAYIVQYNPNTDTFFLCVMDVLDKPGTSSISAAGRDFTPRLDCLIRKDRVTKVDINDEETRITIPSELVQQSINGVNLPITIIFGDAGDSTYYQTHQLNNDGSFIVRKDDAAGQFFCGLQYPMVVELPSFYVINKDKEADRNNVPVIENVQMYMYLSGRYLAKLQRLGYEDKYIDLEAKKCDVYISDSNPINEVGVTEIPLFCKGDLATLSVESLSPLPASVTGYGWKGHYNNRGISTLAK